MPGYSFGYEFDAIGNRTTATVNGTTSNLTPNSLNQIQTRTVPPTVHVRGAANSAHPVTSVGVRLTAEGGSPGSWIPATRDSHGNFYAAMALDNSAAARSAMVEVETTVSVDEGGVKTEPKLTETRQAEVAPAQSGFSHDDDGSIAYDALNQYIYDAENRLIEIVANPGAWGGLLPAGKLLPEGVKFSRVKYAYDAQGRRVQKEVYNYVYTPSPQEVLVKRTRFIWDGWDCVKEIDYDENFQITTRAYIWGPDISGTEQGVGGVGGLLACHLRQKPNPGPSQMPDGTFYGTMLPCYDGNGNIVSYVDAATGAVEQEEEYGPFGENLRPRPTSPKRVPFGWSTKYTDEETGLVAYQLRYYNAEFGRWMSRDRIEEAGGVNITEYIGNNPVQKNDVLGLADSLEKALNEARDKLGKATQESRLASIEAFKRDVNFDEHKTTIALYNAAEALYKRKKNDNRNAEYTIEFLDLQLPLVTGGFGIEHATVIYCCERNGKKEFLLYPIQKGRYPTEQEAKFGIGGLVSTPVPQDVEKRIQEDASCNNAKILAHLHTHNLGTIGIQKPGPKKQKANPNEIPQFKVSAPGHPSDNDKKAKHNWRNHKEIKFYLVDEGDGGDFILNEY